jgi:hypothetical protein
VAAARWWSLPSPPPSSPSPPLPSPAPRPQIERRWRGTALAQRIGRAPRLPPGLKRPRFGASGGLERVKEQGSPSCCSSSPSRCCCCCCRWGRGPPPSS